MSTTDHSKPRAVPYVPGTNERLDVMLNEDEEVWVVQGSKGRRPVSMPLGSTAEDAVIKYATKMTAT